MKKNLFRNRSIQESILFILMGGGLLWYAFDSRSKSFNKDWSQSPYLFPVVVGVLMLILALSLFAQGMKAAEPAAASAKKTTQPVRTLVVTLMSIVYYAALSWVRFTPLAFRVFSLALRISTFEVSTLVFLLAMMLYLGERKPVVLAGVSIGSTLFLSIAFRTLLHVLLP